MKKKVLIVDDNKAILELLAMFLRQLDYEVQTAMNGLAALDVLEIFQPQIMFVDLIMPIINGEKLCRIIRKMPEFNSLFLVIVSAIATEQKIDFLGLGANACIAKGPFDVMQRHIISVLEHVENNKTEWVANKIFGSENILERDITKELLANKNHVETALNNMDDGLLELTADAKIIYANTAATRLLGLVEEKLLSAFFPDFFPAEQRQLVIESLGRQDCSVARIGEEPPIILHGNNLLIKFVPFFDQGRKFIITMIHNITRRKQAELALRQHDETLAELVKERTAALEKTNVELVGALGKIKTLSGMLPICSSCKNIRDDQGYWNQIEVYIRDHSEAEFTHSICPVCAHKLYPEIYQKIAGRKR
ncbi:MAG: hypothetical protein A2521_10405 [Deltaproteobacteria bacterium RIFOXYD12_FULL_57_12]|nr:MAG: hypothetical protein A2521_10405 [Deltaproteobacteria bacterium RIFOXYD12_FULL_57_12]